MFCKKVRAENRNDVALDEVDFITEEVFVEYWGCCVFDTGQEFGQVTES